MKSFKIRNLVMALAVAAGTAGVMAGPALADEWGHGRDRDSRHEEHWRVPPHRVVYARPPVPVYRAPVVPVYRPPVYAYAPPPVAYAQPGLTFQLNFQ